MDTLISGLGFLLVLVLAFSGTAKLHASAAAERSVTALRLERWISRPRLAITSLALIELACAVCMVTGTGAVYLAAVVVAWAMTVGFLVVAVRASRLGSSEDCGCFGEMVASPVGTVMTRRNLALVTVASLSAVSAFLCLVAGRTPSLFGGGVESAGAALVAVLACIVGALGFAGSRHSARPAAREQVNPRGTPALVAALDGEVVDPLQRALRGRAQLLVFVRPGCSSCDDVTDAAQSSPLGEVEPRIVMAVGDGGHVPRDRSERAALAHADLSGTLAEHLGLPAGRPAAALVTTEGRILMPFAEGREQVLDLISTVVAAQASR